MLNANTSNLKDNTLQEVAATLKNRCYQDQQKSAHEEVWCLADSPELNNNQPPTNNQLPNSLMSDLPNF